MLAAGADPACDSEQAFSLLAKFLAFHHGLLTGLVQFGESRVEALESFFVVVGLAWDHGEGNPARRYPTRLVSNNQENPLSHGAAGIPLAMTGLAPPPMEGSPWTKLHGRTSLLVSSGYIRW
jgi:hypothetical protein